MSKLNWFFLDGRLMLVEQKWIDRFSPGRLKGGAHSRGVFETMRAYEEKILLLEDHLQRLFRGLKVLKIQPLYRVEELAGLLRAVLKKNQLKNARVRLMVWKTKSQTHVSIAAIAYKPFSASCYKKGFKATISKIRCPENSPTANIKSIRYEKFLQAYQAARAKGFDEAILFNRRGELMEASRSNIFFVKDKVLFTPSLSCGCLNGITRQQIIKIAHQKGIKLRQGRFSSDDLYEADEVFLTNSLMELMSLTVLGNKKIGNGGVGKIIQHLQRSYKSIRR